MNFALVSTARLFSTGAKAVGIMVLVLLGAIVLNAALGASENARLDQEKQVCLNHNKTPRVQNSAANYMHGNARTQVICE